MKKILATAVLAVAISAAGAAPAMAVDNVSGGTNPGIANANQIGVGQVDVPVTVDCNGAGVAVVGDAVGSSGDCKQQAPNPTPSESKTTPVSNESSDLPVTGASTGIIAGAAVLMIVGGVFAVRVARRRGRHAGAAA